MTFTFQALREDYEEAYKRMIEINARLEGHLNANDLSNEELALVFEEFEYAKQAATAKRDKMLDAS